MLKRSYLFCYQTCQARRNWRNHQSMLIETRKTLRCSSVTFCFLALLFQNFQKIGLNCIILISERVLIHIPKMHSTSCVINFQAALTKSFLLKNVCPITTKKHAYFEDKLHWFYNRTCYGFCKTKMLRVKWYWQKKGNSKDVHAKINNLEWVYLGANINIRCTEGENSRRNILYFFSASDVIPHDRSWFLNSS